MFTKTFLAAFLAAVVAAQSGNPTITPATGEVVPGCKPYTLSWTPTTPGTVSIEIISGATQGTLQPAGVVAAGIPNSGSFVWTPASALGANAVTGYKILVDGSEQFQFSVPFSVSPCEEEPTTTPTAPVDTYPTASETKDTTETYPTETPVVPSSSSCTTTSTVYVNPPSTAYPTAPVHNTTGPYPTTMYPTVPLPSGTGGVYPTAAPTPPAQEFPGAASGIKAGLGLAGAAAAFIFML